MQELMAATLLLVRAELGPSPVPEAAAQVMLQREWHEPFSNDGDDASFNGLNAAMVVIRHLAGVLPLEKSNLAEEETEVDDSRSAAEISEAWLKHGSKDAEPRNALLRFAYSHVPVLDEHNRSKKRPRAATYADEVKILQEKVLDLIAPNGWGSASFLDIMDSDLMVKTMWSHPQLFFYEPQIFWRHQGRPWRKPGDWTAYERPVEMQARESLLRWDGRGTLGRCLTNLAGCFEDPAHKVDILRQQNFPVFVRVVYTPVENGAPGFDDLRTLDICGKDLSAGESLERRSGELIAFQYHLVAAVRLRGNPKDMDVVRTYSVRGEYIRPSFLASRPVSYVADDWRLGDPGHSYLLFLVQSDKRADARFRELCVTSEEEGEVEGFLRRFEAGLGSGPALAQWEENGEDEDSRKRRRSNKTYQVSGNRRGYRSDGPRSGLDQTSSLGGASGRARSPEAPPPGFLRQPPTGPAADRHRPLESRITRPRKPYQGPRRYPRLQE